ncbi:MAG TPA: hypothetical protein VKM55_03100 [Candidatus Lokiarchaeia archaeon]|nr:hypothetical protein [Candidatus Lokiarchaeia archaeon]
MNTSNIGKQCISQLMPKIYAFPLAAARNECMKPCFVNDAINGDMAYRDDYARQAPAIVTFTRF